MTTPGATPADALSVHELTRAAKDVLEGAIPKLWVRGEVSGFKAYPSGHWYFTLKDADAQLAAVVWKGATFKIPAKPEDGMQVMAFGQLTVWPASGKMQFSATMLSADGAGLWQRQFDETKAKLEKDGLLDPARKRAIPRFPRTVAVVTSGEGAALRDIQAVIRRRNPGVHVVLIPALVQGEGAPDSLCNALATLGRWARGDGRFAGEALPPPDVVIVGRGGGSREDLWAFNHERVARAIAACPVPTISAVGHETDLTIADLVADRRAATPSVAAETAVPVRSELQEAVARLAGRMADGLQDRIDAGTRTLTARADALSQRARRLVERRRAGLDRLADRLPQQVVRGIERRRARVGTLAAGLDARSPLEVLRRGFVVARAVDGAPLTRRAAFVKGTPFEVILRDGLVRATTDAVSDRAPHLPMPS